MSSTQKKRILLVQCGPGPGPLHGDADIERFGFEPDRGLERREAPVVPIACATIAALTPDDYHVDIWDENLLGQIKRHTPIEPYDIVGLSVLFSYLGPHAREVGRILRSRGFVVVAGGPGISASPESFGDVFDALFVNEAERTWPQFLRDYERGEIQPSYRQIDKPNLTESPKPDYRAVAANIPRYDWGAVQTTRGCPFDCEFCDVIYLYGRRQRHKAIAQVLDEVRALQELGSRTIFFTDDEFVGDPAYTKELLTKLVPLNDSFEVPLRFYTQLTLNLSRDDELLGLVADANFYSALCGIESFDKASLREVGKHQNAARDPMRDVHHIQSHGLGLWGSFIVGFDSDDPSVFDRLYENIQEASVPMGAVAPLTAFENTKLWARLRGEGRVATVRLRRKEEPLGLIPNITPRGMSRVELIEGYRGLCEKIHAWDAILARIRGFVSGVRRAPRAREAPFTDASRDRFLAEASRAWRLSPSEHAAIGDTLEHTKRVAPHLLPRVAWYLVQSEWLSRYSKRFFIGYERLLELEKTGDLVADTRPLLLPPSFGPAMTGMFPEIFTRLARSLSHEQQIPEAMKEVFVDFIVRWGSTFQKLEPEHRAYLLELCDRAAAKLGGRLGSAPREGEMDLLRDARRRRLLDAVLKDVRDEIATMTAA
ncbi:Hypothetical protein A7982_03393 [Minicystis rosea]|nr:Hypothetical protein A7982_03393 [Minicystis rosea]